MKVLVAHQGNHQIGYIGNYIAISLAGNLGRLRGSVWVIMMFKLLRSGGERFFDGMRQFESERGFAKWRDLIVTRGFPLLILLHEGCISSASLEDGPCKQQ